MGTEVSGRTRAPFKRGSLSGDRGPGLSNPDLRGAENPDICVISQDEVLAIHFIVFKYFCEAVASIR